MGTLHPYLQRRGNRLFFRIAVPAELRPLVGLREFTAALKTGDRAAAVPLALELGPTAHRLFNDLSTTMSTDKDMMKVLGEARSAVRLAELREQMQQEIDDAGSARISAIHQVRHAAERDVREAVLRAQVQVLDSVLERALSAQPQPAHLTPLPMPTAAPAAVQTLLHVLIDRFLGTYAKERKPAMFKKHQAARGLLKDLHGARHRNWCRLAHRKSR